MFLVLNRKVAGSLDAALERSRADVQVWQERVAEIQRERESPSLREMTDKLQVEQTARAQEAEEASLLRTTVGESHIDTQLVGN